MAESDNTFDKLSVADTLKKLDTDKAKGLSTNVATERLQQYGANALEESRSSWWRKLVSYFWGPIPWMIEVAVILSAVVEHWLDFGMILAMLLINALLGFVQEYKADNAIQLLKNKLALKARVLRDGKWQDIEAAQLVPGDIVKIKLGNIIPADVKLIEGDYLSIDQSALTGESLAVNKKIGDSAYSGSVAKLGEMTGVVTATGMQTYFGKTAQLVKSAKVKSHFQQAIVKIGNFLIFTTLIVCAAILVANIWRHDPIGQSVLFALVLTIAAIPVALPAVLSVTMAIGAAKLAKLHAIVSRLVAIEELAGIDVLCSDKTGTLTKNQLAVGEPVLFAAKDETELYRYAALASQADSEDAIDKAILQKLNQPDIFKQVQISHFTPFDPISKRTEATVKEGKTTFNVIKGAPQVVLDIAVNKKSKAYQEALQKVDDFAARGFRTLGVAVKKGSSWQFLGLISLLDPPRDDSKATIAEAQAMGIHVKMVTGDHTAIALETAKALNLGTKIYPVSQVFGSDVSASNSRQAIETADGFAEVFPEHKFEIVESLQHQKHIVAMTGDGVNDAPALKQADVGIAVSGATDAARSAADLVLTEPGLDVITEAVREARRIFGRMKSYAMYRISETVRLLLFLGLAMLFLNLYPVTAVMIVLIALLNDIPIMMIAYDNMAVHEEPVAWRMKEVLTIALAIAVVNVISTFLLYWIGETHWHLHQAQLQTLAFFSLLVGGNLTIYLTRNHKWLLSKPLPNIKFLCATLGTQILGILICVYGWFVAPLGWALGIQVIIYLLIWFVVSMVVKDLIYRVIDSGTSHGAHPRFIQRVHQSLQQ